MWLTGPVAPRHVGSSQTRARTRVPCIGRQILNHCATREAPVYVVLSHRVCGNLSDQEEKQDRIHRLIIWGSSHGEGWVFVSVQGLSPVAASGGHSSSRCMALSLSRPLLLRSTGSRRAGSVIVAHGPNCSAACGILPDQGSNPCPLHWQADPQPLHHQGSPCFSFINRFICVIF